jgi:chemotaxis protein MotB
MTIRIPPSEAAEAGDTRWLVTFADLVALVLAFFVMLYATQKVEQGEWQAMVRSLSQSLKVTPQSDATPNARRNARPVDPARASDLAYLETLIEGVRDRDPALSGIVIRNLDDRLVVALPGDLLFASGRTEPAPGAAGRIAALAQLLGNIANRVDLFGHTDPAPLSGRGFESNWELSLARAESVAAMMRAAGYGRPLGAFGLADTRYADLGGIASAARKQQLARRVDIVIRTRREPRR